ncbi:hypothetical protein ACFOED_10170 [Vulcaniibacterium thermophilum]|uniref:Lipoprotein n=1 Tax=Vulcaniibacterium thermophilum TaxID=1169913 RepID=A0A918ZBZ7_9GAMM|nr:hypothetical protein [Vulcaniibacterium thermophilum]GHE44955.1 hypothetical protein GCM10007167_28180 [Vulcaniibacterium thermophilum]
MKTNICKTAGLVAALLIAPCASAADGKVYEINAEVDCFTTDQNQPVCNLLMGSDDLAKYWGQDVANGAVVIGLTETAAESAKLGFDAAMAAQARKDGCHYIAGASIKAKKGTLEEDEGGYYPGFKLVEVLGRNDFRKDCSE